MVGPHAQNGRDQQLGAGFDAQTDHAGDIGGLLSDRHGTHGAGLRIDYRPPQQLRLPRVADVRAELREFPDDGVINLVIDDHRLFGGANGSVVEGLGGDDVHHGHVQLRRLLQVDRRVARSHAQGRLARTVGRLDRARSARGVDQLDLFVMHQVHVVRDGGRFDAGKDAFRSAMLRPRPRT